MQLNGKYGVVLDYLTKLESDKYFLNITDLYLAPQATRGVEISDQTPVELSLKLTLYVGK